MRAALGNFFGSADEQLCEPGKLPREGIFRVLVCRPNHRLGNALLISPLLKELEAIYPGAEIDIVSGGIAAAQLFESRFQVRRVMSLPQHIARHPWQAGQRFRSLRRDRYDLAVDPGLHSNSGRLLLSFSRSRYKVGFPVHAHGRAADYLEDVPPHHARHGVHLMRVALGERSNRPWPTLNINLSPAEIDRGRQALLAILGATGRTTQPIVGVFTNATQAKRLPPELWRDVVHQLYRLRPRLRVVDVLPEHGASQLGTMDRCFYSRNLRKLAAVIASMDAFISADCGIMHLASAVSCPTLGLFTRDNREHYEPYGNGSSSLDLSTRGNADALARRIDHWLLTLQ